MYLLDVRVPSADTAFKMLKRRQERAASGPGGYRLGGAAVSTSFDLGSGGGESRRHALQGIPSANLPGANARAVCTPADAHSSLVPRASFDGGGAASHHRRSSSGGGHKAGNHWIGVIKQ